MTCQWTKFLKSMITYIIFILNKHEYELIKIRVQVINACYHGTFMSKYEDNAMELIETVAENSHHNTAKPFGRDAMPKSAETGMLHERIDKMAKVHNLLLD